MEVGLMWDRKTYRKSVVALFNKQAANVYWLGLLIEILYPNIAQGTVKLPEIKIWGSEILELLAPTA